MSAEFEASPLRALLPELRAIISGLRGQLPESETLDWDRLSYLARVHGVGPLLYDAWHAAEGTVPAPTLDDFRGRYQETALVSALGLCQRDQVLQMLEQANIPVIVLKGAALARRWYGDVSLRPFSDIDLWLPSSLVDQATRLLVGAGYEEMEHPGAAAHHGLPLRFDGLPCAVELHHELTRLPLARAPEFEDFYRRSILIEESVRALNPEDTLLHLCLHLLHHLDYDHGWRLRELCDIERHLHAFAVNWESFAATARTTDTYPACRAVLGLAHLVMNANTPPQHADHALALEILQQPVTMIVRHHRQAAFLAAIAQGQVERAMFLFGTWISERGRSGLGIRAAPPSQILRSWGRYIRSGRSRKRMAGRQMSDSLERLRNWDRSERLVARLLAQPETVGEQLPETDRPSRERRLARWIGLPHVALALVVLLLLALRTLLRPIQVRGTSMEPTLRPGQRLLALRRRGSSAPLRHGEVILLKHPHGRKSLGIKRIIALPCETVKIRRGQISIDDRPIVESYGVRQGTSSWGPATVPPGHYFVLGDNRHTSIDSRDWGWLPGDSIVGRVWLSYWPPSRWLSLLPLRTIPSSADTT